MAGQQIDNYEYAIISWGNQQYRVSPNEEIDILGLADKKEGEKIKFDRVLLVKNKEVKIGQPLVEKASVEAEILKQFRGEKIRVATYRAKSRYRRVKGFRPELTRVKILKINS
ncbi:50S ribosomal protein L21 [Candidatus Shapirobacteria bacterium]|nr:50S ribosomal protein L21 [Candidatus Shapirobacteria bacterium]